MREGNRTCEAVVTMDSFSEVETPRAETTCRKAAVMAASTKAARRLGRNDMANSREVLLNLVTGKERKVLKSVTGKRFAQNGMRPVREVTKSARHTDSAAGGKELPKSFIDR